MKEKRTPETQGAADAVAIMEKTTIADIYRAAYYLDNVTTKTPLIESPYFSSICGNTVLLKPENLQVTGSFKLRGAYNRISQLSDEERAKGVITASAGNHAQGVAFASQKLGVKAVICMPATTPILKVEATRAYGAEIVLHGDAFDDAYAKSLELQKEKGYVYIHPFNDLNVLLGQGTTAKEIIDDCKDVDVILVPIGGGGFASGVAMAAKLVNPHVKVIGVEPAGAACMKPGGRIEKGPCMKVSTRVEYGMIALVDIAIHSQDGSSVSTLEISRRQNISKKYLEHILLQLKTAGFIKAQKGAGGGYTLSCSAEKVTLSDILNALDGSILEEMEPSSASDGELGQAIDLCLWKRINNSLRKYAEGITLAGFAAQCQSRISDDWNMYII